MYSLIEYPLAVIETERNQIECRVLMNLRRRLRTTYPGIRHMVVVGTETQFLYVLGQPFSLLRRYLMPGA